MERGYLERRRFTQIAECDGHLNISLPCHLPAAGSRAGRRSFPEEGATVRRTAPAAPRRHRPLLGRAVQPVCARSERRDADQRPRQPAR